MTPCYFSTVFICNPFTNVRNLQEIFFFFTREAHFPVITKCHAVFFCISKVVKIMAADDGKLKVWGTTAGN